MPGKLPPELAARKDLTDIYLAGTRYARRCLRGRPEDVITELVHDCFIKLGTTHRWAGKLPLEDYFLILVRNAPMEVWRHGHGDVVDDETAAQYLNHEVNERFVEAMAPDEVLIEREERDARAALAPAVLAELDAIESVVAHHPIASGVIAQWKALGPDIKPQALAHRLGVSVHQVYKAKDLIKYHARRIRERLNEHQGEAS